MRAVLDDRQSIHDPKHFMANGAILPSPEQPARIGVLRAGAEAAGCVFEAPVDAGPRARRGGAHPGIHPVPADDPCPLVPDRGGGARGHSEHPSRFPRRGLSPLGRGAGGLSPGRHGLSDRRGHVGVRLLVGADGRHGGGDRRRTGRARSMPSVARRATMPIADLAGGILLSQQRRHRGGTAHAGAACALPSSTWTCITATAHRASSRRAATC